MFENFHDDSYDLVRGYDITVKSAQTGFFVVINDASRVFKTGNVFDWIIATRRGNENAYKQIVQNRLRNSIVYNT